MSVPEPADDVHDLLQGNWPKDDEDKFVVTADAYAREAGVHANDAALHRATINTLHEGVWVSRPRFPGRGWRLRSCHASGEGAGTGQFCVYY